MADLADQIDDFICSFEGVGDLTMDTLAMFIFAWAVLALFLLWLCKYLYKKYVLKKNDTTITTTTTTTIGGTTTATTSGVDPNKNLNETNEKLRKSEPRDVIGSNKDLVAKPLSKALTKSQPKIGGIGGYTSPSSQAPNVRKRLSRKSPGPELRKPRPALTPPSNVVGPDTVAVTWTSQVFRWLYTDLVIVNELLHSWVIALNEFTNKTVDDHGVAVEIVRILPESPQPIITNLFCNNAENNPSDLTVTWDCDSTPVLQVKAFRQKSGKVETSHYKATVSRFRGHLSTRINYLTIKGEMKVEGYPDIRVALNSIGPIKGDNQDESHLQDLVSEILVNAIRGTVYPIDFSIYSTCPRAIEMESPEISVNFPTHYDSLANNMEQLNPMYSLNTLGSAVSSGKRLLVKVVKGDSLIHANDPYCVVEMDEPPQKNQTGARQGSNPYWDEHFLFDLSPNSAEILFEIYDRPINPNDPIKFLGLGLVGIDELSVGPASSQILTLQPRPYETQKVNGAITVEFVFIEGAEVPTGRRPYKLKEALKLNTQSPSFNNETQQNGKDIADAAIRAIERGALSSSNPSKSTLIIHSVQRNDVPVIKVVLNNDGKIEVDESMLDNVQNTSTVAPLLASPDLLLSPTDIFGVSEPFDRDVTLEDIHSNGITDMVPGDPMAHSSPQNNYHNGHTPRGTLQRDGLQMPLNNHHQNEQLLDDIERGRTKRKKDFFGTLKRSFRLGRSKTRTKSMDRGMIPIDAENPNGGSRSISADRGIMSNNTSGPRLIVPQLDQSRRSSLSESSAISGLSSASTRTYTHEASTLVLETLENGVKRHFLVPLAIAQRPRWRRKGTKLHIYNDHTFVAKHLSGGLTCDVCNRSIPRRPGKQGYECRDCTTKCHKQCHVRAPQSCSNPTVLSIELSKLNSAAADRSIRKL